MPRTRIDLDSVIAAAVELVDSSGLESLTLSNVAEALDVRPSALYTHVDGAGHLHYVVAVAATDNLTTAVRNAAIGVAGHDAVLSVTRAYSDFARRYPGQYAATFAPPSTDDERLDDACAALLEVISLVFRSLGLTEEQAAGAAVSLRSTLHGFLALQSAGQPAERSSADNAGETPSQLDLVLDALLHGLIPRSG